ncbi:MAG: hypothetical protein H7842_15275, partial [Gammaproteobacteria bacterium SHHR-1]
MAEFTGTVGDDVLVGFADLLDTLKGGEGDDILIAEVGVGLNEDGEVTNIIDSLYGELGDDIYRFRGNLHTGVNFVIDGSDVSEDDGVSWTGDKSGPGIDVLDLTGIANDLSTLRVVGVNLDPTSTENEGVLLG